MFSVTLLTLDTIGLIPIGFLCIFLRKYSCEVLCSGWGLQKSHMFTCMSLVLHALLRNSNIFIFVSLVVSFVSLLYTRGLFRCFRPCFM